MTSPRSQNPAGPSLYLLGGVELRGLPTDDATRLLSQTKVVGLLACLALAPAGSFTRRDRLVGLLWPELDQLHARAALRKAIHFARAVLGETTLVNRGDEELGLDGGALWCDASDVRRAIERGHLERAIELYRGDLMPGFFLPGCHDFDGWLESERSSLLEDVVAACWALAKHLESNNQGTDAVRHAKKAARLAWSDERVLRRSIEMLVRLGDRAGALRAYEEFARRLRKELESEPSPETVRLMEAVRTGTYPAAKA
jgi:DNA-binding SARP family transcriptional activator